MTYHFSIKCFTSTALVTQLLVGVITVSPVHSQAEVRTHSSDSSKRELVQKDPEGVAQSPSGEKVEIRSEGARMSVIYQAPSQRVFGNAGCLPLAKRKGAQTQIRNWQSHLPYLQNCTLESSRVEESEALREGCEQYKDEIFFVKQESVYRCSDIYLVLMRKKISNMQVDYSSDGLKIHVDEWITSKLPLY